VYPSFNLGRFFFAFGRPDLTLREAERLWSTAPSEELAVIEGEAALRSGRLATSLPRLEAALRRHPGSAEIERYVALGLAFRAQELLDKGSPKEAELDLHRMLALTPDACGPYCGLAKAAVLQGDVARAQRLLAEALRKDTDGTCRHNARRDPHLAPLLDRGIETP